VLDALACRARAENEMHVFAYVWARAQQLLTVSFAMVRGPSLYCGAAHLGVENHSKRRLRGAHPVSILLRANQRCHCNNTLA